MKKSKTLTAILATWLGAFGADYFYQGNKKMGIICLCVTLLVCCLGYIAMSIWGLVRGIKLWVELTKEETANGGKSQRLAGFFAAALGAYGVDYLYLGNKKLGFILLGVSIAITLIYVYACIILTIISGVGSVLALIFIVPLFALQIWGIVRAIKIWKPICEVEMGKEVA
jgi:hypothetical protein